VATSRRCRQRNKKLDIITRAYDAISYVDNLPAERLDAVIERANCDNVTRSALTNKALAAYLELSSIREPYTKDITEIIRLQTRGQRRTCKENNETIGALRLALDISDIRGRATRNRGREAG